MSVRGKNGKSEVILNRHAFDYVFAIATLSDIEQWEI
tara:strand:- start:1265 stop:1375 length:111 start_codon:yes stop_codon:yes gene_type:complete